MTLRKPCSLYVFHLDVIHALCSDTGVHLLVTIQLVSNSPADFIIKGCKHPNRVIIQYVCLNVKVT